MKERVTVYFPDTAMISFLRDHIPLDPYYMIPHGEYHFIPGESIDRRFNSVMMHGDVNRMTETHGSPSTLIMSAEDAGIIQLTSYEYEALTKSKEKDATIARLTADAVAYGNHITDLENHINDIQFDAKKDVEDAYRQGYEEGQSDILSA